MAMVSVSDQGRQLRLAASAITRRLAYRYHASAFYAWRYAGAVPDRLLIAPIDLRTADPTVALEIYSGRFVFNGEAVDVDGQSVFEIAAPSEDWAHELHRFGWLRHLRATDMTLSRENARSLVDEWIAQARRVDPVAREPEVVASRIISWLSHTPLILDGCDHVFYRRFMRSLAKQVRYLRRTAYDGRSGLPRIRVMIALASAALCMADQTSFMRQASKWLDLELVRQVLPDGGHISRNPDAVLEILIDLLPLRQAFTARGAQPSRILLSAIDRMMPMLRFFRQGDGSFAHFNGAGDTAPDQLATVLAYDDVRGAPLSGAPHSGYQRIEAGSAVVLIDAGRPPPIDFSIEAHAGCLSFEMSVGRQRLVVNCGVPAANGGPLRRLSRTTAAHSTITLNDSSSCRFLARSWIGDWLGEAIIGGPSRVDVARHIEGDSTVVSMRHNGYVDRYGIVHERRMGISEAGDRVDGMDAFLSPAGKPVTQQGEDNFAIRFHLHPNVSVSVNPDGQGISLELPDGERWLFQASGGEVSIEESILMSATRGNRRTNQIVISGLVQQVPVVYWQMLRIAVAGRRRRISDATASGERG